MRIQHQVLRFIGVSAAISLLTFSVAPLWSQVTAAAAGGAPSTEAPATAKGASLSSFGMPPRVDPDELEHMARTFDLSEDQQELVQAVYDGYTASYMEQSDLHSEEMNAMREEARETRDFRGFADQLRQRREEWYEGGHLLEDQFFEDVKTILSPDQLDLWPKYERDYRRRSTLDRGARFSGEAVDLFVLVDSLEFPTEMRDSLDPMLDSYAEELDRALIVRNELFEKYQSSFRSGGSALSPEQRVQISDDLDDQRRSVRDINTRYAQSLASQLPAAEGERLLDEFQRQSFPWIYRESAAEEYVNGTVLELEDLTDDQRAQIEDTRDQFVAELESLRHRLADLQRERENSMKTTYSTNTPDPDRRRRIEEARRLGQMVGDLHRQQQDIVERGIEAVFVMLTPAQQEAAPKPNVRRMGGDLEEEGIGDGGGVGRPQRPGAPGQGPTRPPNGG